MDNVSKAKHIHFLAIRITLVHAAAMHAVYLRGSEDAVMVQPVCLSTNLLSHSSASQAHVNTEHPNVRDEV